MVHRQETEKYMIRECFTFALTAGILVAVGRGLVRSFYKYSERLLRWSFNICRGDMDSVVMF